MIKILLIDDEPKIVYDMLTLYGYDVSTAPDGLAGTQILLNTDNHFELVILDLHMPKLDGWAVLKAIRNSTECPEIPVIMLTSADNEDSIVSGLRRGADIYLTKPIAPKQLFAHIEALCRRSNWTGGHDSQDKEDSKAKDTVKLLTQRESEILKCVVQGMSNQQIGEKLVISETTVKNHLVHIYKKLNVTSRTQAAFLVQKLKLFS
jgi:DNA-binding NarL/FixJ family response regulator